MTFRQKIVNERSINWTGVGFGLSLAVLAAYQQLKLPPVLPILLRDYGFDRILAGGFMSVYALCGLVLSFGIGNLMVRHGKAVFVYAAFGLFLAAAAITMIWPAHGWLFLFARALEGIAFAVMAIAGPAICTANVGPRGLPAASAIVATWIPLGALLANGLSAAFVETAGWRVLWWTGIAATLALLFWTMHLRRRGGMQWGGATAHTTSGAADGGDASAARRATPAHWRVMAFSAFLFTLWSIQMFGYLTWLAEYLVDVVGHGPRQAAMLYMIPVAVLCVFNLIGGWLLRAGVPVALLLAANAAIQGMVWFALPHLGPAAAAVAALGVFGAAAGVTPTCLFALPGTIFGVAHADTRAFGILMTGRNCGVLIGPILVGALVHATDGWHIVPQVLGGVTAALTLGALLLHRFLKRLDAT